MIVRIRFILEKLASLLSIVWGLRNDKRWRLAAKWSAGLWGFNTVLFIFTLKYFGNPYLAIAVRTAFTEAQSFVVNKTCIFPHRQVSVASSSSLSTPMAVFCFAYHKATGLLLIAAGLGTFPVMAVLTGIGVVENPLRFLFNNKFPFAEKT